ncbi:serine hydrolase domain-containing protein [Roseateles sp.]
MPTTHHSLTGLIAAFIGGCLLAVFAPAGAAGLDEANAMTRQFVQKTMQERRIPGLQIAVIQDGQLVLSESYGLASVENQVPATNTTLFPLNSGTKPVTGVAMAQLAQAGLVDLNAPISRYLDDLPATWRAIRVRQLLAHTSGLPDIVEEPGLMAGSTEAGMWKAVKARPVEAQPGERFAYNQTNYGLLAQIIAKQTGMPYEQYVAQRQFAVADMRASTFGDSYDPVPHAATIYSYFPRRTLAANDANRLSRWLYEIPYSLNAGGGLLTTANEMARWIMALTSGRLMPMSQLDGMWAPEKLNGGASGDWSAGWPVLAVAPHRQVAGIGGNRSAFVIYPDDGLAIVVLTNLVGGNPERFIPQIAELYSKRLPGQLAH